MKIEVPIVSAFVDGDSGGNPAGVVLNAERFSYEQKQKEVIKRLQPDLDLIEKLSDALDLIGFYAFSFDGVEYGRDAGARMFAPLYGIQEESATGMAAGPLACYLREHLGIDKAEFSLEQGRWMSPPSPSVINVRLHIGANGNVESLFAGGRGALKETTEVELW